MKRNLIIILLIAFTAASLLITCIALQNRYNQGLIEYQMTWDGYERTYLVHLPPEAKRQRPMPLLFHLHGGGGTAKGTPGLTFGRFNELADRDGFIVVYPNAIEKNWNDGRKSHLVTSWQENINDVGFISEIVSVLDQEYNIDKDRIFTSGMSNGGFMSSRLLCDRADLFRGGAILTATLSADYLPQCNPALPAAVLIMNGTDDKLIPYDGGQVRVLRKPRGEIISTDRLVSFWEEKNGCTTKKPPVTLPDKKDDGTIVHIREYADCNRRGSLILYRIEGGGHTWAGGKQYLGEGLIGKTGREIVACDVIWEYFRGL